MQLLAEIQAGLYAEAKARLDGNIKSDVTDWAGVENYFAGSDEEFKGWLRVSWSKPSGAALEAVDSQAEGAEAHHPQCAAPTSRRSSRACVFTGAPGVEEILIGRAY